MNDDLDDLASAYLDGEVTDEEALRVESDPELLGRVEALGRFRLGSLPTPEPDPAVRDRHLAVARDEFASLVGGVILTSSTPLRGEGGDTDDAAAGVIDLRSRSTRAAGGRRWLAAVAAGIVVVAGVGYALGRGGREGSSDTAMNTTTVSDQRSLEMATEAASDGDSAAGQDSVEEESESMASEAGDAVDDAPADESLFGGPTLYLDPRPSAADALQAAIDAGLLADNADGVDEEQGVVPGGCEPPIDDTRPLVAVVLVQSPEGDAYLYVYGETDPRVAALVDPSCNLISVTP